MKKLCALILVTAMCFSLVACSENDNAYNDSSTQQQTEWSDNSKENISQVADSQAGDSDVVSHIKDKIDETAKCVAIIRVQINPAFDIYLDENNNVLAVDYINSDAQQALANIDVIGQNGMDALQTLVIAVLRTELAEEDIMVYITPVYRKENALAGELVNDIPFVLSQLQISSQSNASISVEFDDDGIIETQDSDTEVIEDENGNIIKTVAVDDAGKTTTLYFDENGNVEQRIETHPDGVMYIRTYYWNGELKEATEKYPAGDYTTQTFDANGIKLSQESAYVNGAGTLVWSKFLYDSGGNVTEYYGQDNFGRPVHKIHNSDGSSVTYRTEADGSVTTVHYDCNGNIIHQ